MSTFEAVILAGGKGTRLRSITGKLPKPMVDINGEPFLYKLLRRLESAGCSRIVLSLGYQSEYIIERVLQDKVVQCDVVFSVESRPLGTGGGLKLASKYVSGTHFLALNGDTYSGLDYRSFFYECFDSNVDFALGGVPVEDCSRYGTLNINYENMELIGFNEKGVIGPGVINIGSYVIKKALIVQNESDEFSLERDFILPGSRVVLFDGYFIDLGIPSDYVRALSELA